MERRDVPQVACVTRPRASERSHDSRSFDPARFLWGNRIINGPWPCHLPPAVEFSLAMFWDADLVRAKNHRPVHHDAQSTPLRDGIDMRGARVDSHGFRIYLD